MEYKGLVNLNIDTQKDEIIARLLLQRFYSASYSGLYSDKEIDFTLKFILEEDKDHYSEAYNAMLEYKADTGYNWLVD
jgi:hypothetical protein|tara:strand:- start:305 stop:538 length:234 start_codon:yes stop_codon:yes gene_type:complete